MEWYLPICFHVQSLQHYPLPQRNVLSRGSTAYRILISMHFIGVFPTPPRGGSCLHCVKSFHVAAWLEVLSPRRPVWRSVSRAGVEELNGGLTSREASLCYSRKGFRKQIFKPLRDSLRSGFSSLAPKGRIRHIKCWFPPQISAMWKKFSCEWHDAKIYDCFAR